MESNARVGVYARVSSERQAEEGTIDSQIASLREYIKAKQYSLDEDFVFTDEAVSGATLERPGLEMLRDKAAAGQLDKVIVLCPDRLARKHSHQLVIVEELKRLGVDVEFANHVISDSPEDQLLFQMQGAIAEFEREKIIERSRRGRLHKARNGNVSVLGGAPYGYVYIRRSPSENARYEIHEGEAEVVRRVFKLLVLEQKCLNEIARKLTAEHVPSPKGGESWCRNTLYRMVTNPAYIGKAAYRKRKVVARKRVTKLSRDRGGYPRSAHSSRQARPLSEWITIGVPQIVSDSLFERAREQLRMNKRFSPRNQRNEYLITGLARCKGCGYGVYGKACGGNHGRGALRKYYRCFGQDTRFPYQRVCAGSPVRIEVVDELIWEQTKQLIQQPEVVLQQYSERVNKKRQARQDIEVLRAKKQKEIRAHQLEKQRLLDVYQSGAISLEEIRSRLDTIRAQIKRAEQECELIEREAHQELQRLQLIEHFADFKRKFDTNLDSLTFEQRRQIVRLLVQEVIVDFSAGNILVKHVVPIHEMYRLRNDAVQRSLFRTNAGEEKRRTAPASAQTTALFCYTD